MLFSTKKPVGVVAYGTRVPSSRITGRSVAKRQNKLDQKIYQALGVNSKSVPNLDEDTITLSVAAAFEALKRLEALLGKKVSSGLGALFIGSESHPYAVKPSGTVVAQALGITSSSFKVTKPLAMADLQFACKAGTQALQIATVYATVGFSKYTMAIGADTAQAKPGDVLEYTASAGGAAFILSKDKTVPQLARVLATTSIATDTPDFWRRSLEQHPAHAGRFTAKPGYFKHILLSVKQILLESNLKLADIDYFVFHTPNTKFPVVLAKKLGISLAKLEPSLLVKEIGNTYAAASMLGLASTLDLVESGKKILVASYGSGSGSDAFILETTTALIEARKKWQKLG